MKNNLPPKGIFITGTDTGVGKTVVTAALASLFSEQGLAVGVMKPIQTGCLLRRGKRIPIDALYLLKAVNKDPELQGEMDRVCPYRFRDPVTPLLAAEREGVGISLNRILTAYRYLSARHRIMLVEGIGGLLAPITSKTATIHLALRMRLPLLVVASTRLGTINHTLLTLQSAKQAGATVLGVVLNNPNPSGSPLAVKTNSELLSRLSGVPILGTLPYMSELSVEKGKLGRVRRLRHHLNRGLHHLRGKLNI